MIDKKYLRENPEVFDEIEKQVREFHGLTEQPSSESTPKEEDSPKSKGAKKTKKEELEEIKVELDEIEIEE